MPRFHLPDLGEGLASATIQAWHVAMDDMVAIDQPLLSVETAKAVVEIPSPFAGRVSEIMAEVDSQIEVGAPLITIEGNAPSTVVGELAQKQNDSEDQAPIVQTHDAIKPLAMPAVRALAQSLGVDLNQVTGSGPNGTILIRDLSAFMQPTSQLDPVLSGHRQAMAHAMVQSHQSVVPATLHETLQMEAMIKPFTLHLIKACIEACQAVPALNAHYQAHKHYHVKENVHLALAVNGPHGLFAPVIKEAETCSDTDLLDALAHFKQQAQANSFSPEAFNNHSFTLSNIGSMGGTFGTPIVLPPAVGILSVGRTEDMLRLNESGKVCVYKNLPLSLSFDHRVVTGAEAALWLQHFKAALLCSMAIGQTNLCAQMIE